MSYDSQQQGAAPMQPQLGSTPQQHGYGLGAAPASYTAAPMQQPSPYAAPTNYTIANNPHAHPPQPQPVDFRGHPPADPATLPYTIGEPTPYEVDVDRSSKDVNYAALSPGYDPFAPGVTYGQPLSEYALIERTKQMLHQRQWTQAQLRKQMDCGQPYVSAVLLSRRKLDPKHCHRLINVLLREGFLSVEDHRNLIHYWVSTGADYTADVWKTAHREKMVALAASQKLQAEAPPVPNISTDDIAVELNEQCKQWASVSHLAPRCRECHQIAPLQCNNSYCGKHCYLHPELQCNMHPRDYAIDDYEYDVPDAYRDSNPGPETATFLEIHGYATPRVGTISGYEIPHSAQPAVKEYPIHHYSQCTKCQGFIAYNDRARLLRCAICTHVQPVTAEGRLDIAHHPLPNSIASQGNKTAVMKAQVEQWTVSQVSVFMRNLKLEHLVNQIEANQVDGRQLLNLNYGEVIYTLGINSDRDATQLMNAVSILRQSNAVPTPQPAPAPTPPLNAAQPDNNYQQQQPSPGQFLG